MRKVRIVGLRKIVDIVAPGKRRLPLTIDRPVEEMFDDVHEDRVETTLPPVLEISLGLRLRDPREQRPRRVAHHQKRPIVLIQQPPLIPRDLQRIRHHRRRDGGRRGRGDGHGGGRAGRATGTRARQRVRIRACRVQRAARLAAIGRAAAAPVAARVTHRRIGRIPAERGRPTLGERRWRRRQAQRWHGRRCGSRRGNRDWNGGRSGRVAAAAATRKADCRHKQRTGEPRHSKRFSGRR